MTEVPREGARQPGVISAVPALAAMGRAVLLLLFVALLAPQPVVLPLKTALRTALEAEARHDHAARADALETAAARLPYSSALEYRSGLADLAAGRFDSAARRIRTAASQDGWTSESRTALGDALAGLGHVDAAAVEWEIALAEVPTDRGLLARLASYYERAGRYPEAIELLGQLGQSGDLAAYYRLTILTAALTPVDALARIAILEARAPDLAPVLGTLRSAIETGRMSGNDAYTKAVVGLAFVQLREWALAEIALSQALAAEPGFAEAYAYLGLAQDMQHKDGLMAYDNAIRLDPESPLIQFLTGLHWRRLENSDRALPYLMAAQGLDPDNPAVAAEIGGAHASLGNITAAEHWLVRAVQLDQRNPAFWLLLARFYVDHEYQVAEAGLPAARMAAGLDPDSPQAADTLGFALVLTGDLVNGRKFLDLALAADDSLASAHYHLGHLLGLQGARQAAESHLQRALALDPEGSIGGLALKALAHLAP
jgi:cellulose synthase operon protein C